MVLHDSFFPLQVFVAPPLFRKLPSWYSTGLTQVAARFSSVFTLNPPPNLKLLPSFPCQDLEAEGKFLKPVSGLHYILHLFDQTTTLLANISLNTEGRLIQVQEQVRHHEDRMTYLESNHVTLQGQVSTKVAADAEFSDWIQNRNEEDWIVIKGLPRLTGVSDKEWPNAIKKQVTETISMVLHASRTRLDYEVQYVVNPFRLRNTGPTLYNVRMDSFFTSKRIRDVFSSFFRQIRPNKLPSALKGVSFRNKITLETKVRISIMHQIGSRFKDATPGASYKVRGFDPRPTLVTIPARSANARVRTLNFIQAVSFLPEVQFTDENLVRIFQVVGDRFRGKLQALFVVLNDDDHDRCLELVKASFERSQRSGPPSGGTSGGASGGGAFGGASGSSATAQNFGQVHGFGSGMDLETGLLKSLSHPPPPPTGETSSFPTETSNSRAHDDRVRYRRREDVRLPTPDPDLRGLKRTRQSSWSDSSSRSDSHQRHKKTKKSKKSKKSKKRSRRYSSSSDSDSTETSRSGSKHQKSPSQTSKSNDVD